MNIYEFLKEYNARLSCGFSWLVWDDDINQWVVWQRKPYERRNGCLYRGDSADEAIKCMEAK
ncbi:hypothetical protein LCGC14_1251430 [marine sediment metagenome]|uniref:Uncharacterized protein n=1 Tax=marine sediment metagenome TaxID=412755 RepID=A0A0F9P6V2_9ZZZZ